ncbi:MAG TPA: hypothetical protein ENJ82_10680 [Bacteroidetes bacterium]|nr:hypothetical protein [Bacteroidota bacterium]
MSLIKIPLNLDSLAFTINLESTSLDVRIGFRTNNKIGTVLLEDLARVSTGVNFTTLATIEGAEVACSISNGGVCELEGETYNLPLNLHLNADGNIDVERVEREE